jgi:transposase
MDRTAEHEWVHRMRFTSLLDRQERSELTQAEAAELLGISERTFRRHRDRYHADGAMGLGDGRLGRRSPKRAAEAEIERMLGLYRDKYADFTVKHFHEQLQSRHNYKLGYTVTKVHLHRAGLVRPATTRSAHRKKRPRRPLVGMMLHQDGSRHAWLEGHTPLDLIVTMDDATSAIYSMFLVEEEGTASTFQGLREVVERHGLFCSFYTDRGSHYFYTPKAGEKVSKTQLTQVGRALQQLGIEHIAAYSPEARGRSERAFRTLQDRLPKELRLAGITTVAEANAWLAATYLARHNAQFAIQPETVGTAFVVDTTGVGPETLCIQDTRVVANDNTIAWNNRRLQIPASRLRPHFVKAMVRVHEYPDGTISVFLGPNRLARYTAEGAELVAAPTDPSVASYSEPSRPSPHGRAKCAALTAPARDAVDGLWVGAPTRPSSRTKKRTQAPAPPPAPT